jgi:import receptor subunit TOM70
MAPTIPATGTPSAPLPSDSSLWDRVSTWVSEHKAVVYTIAGVAVVVTTAGAVYYIRSVSSHSSKYLPHLLPGLAIPY